MPYILSTSYCPRVTDISYIDRNSFLDLVLTSFRNIKSADKKHWHHRPIYRVRLPIWQVWLCRSLISWKLLDGIFKVRNWRWIISSAERIKSKLSCQSGDQNLKGTAHKNGVDGRAGRHFVYAFKYVMYYIHLLEILKDRDTLRLIAPKIRKASVSIVNHTKAWEYLCTTYLRVPATTFKQNLTLVITRTLGDSSQSRFLPSRRIQCCRWENRITLHAYRTRPPRSQDSSRRRITEKVE
jgi:hypothetical protein